jgi:benzoyl-CoA reductase/2-hydroxyglutaryl-CoA dehydratase subunit BcrC/BadD/HgdB
MRRAYIREQQARGRKAVAVLPVHYPKPLLTAMDVLAVELWGPPGSPRGPDAGRLQAYVCAVARNALAFLAAGHADVVDGVLFPHTCDSIQGLATLAPDFGGWAKPCFRYLHPKGEERPSSRAFVRAELESLARELATLTGKALRFAAEGAPLLYLEGELEAELSAQAQTRIEAFCEMVAARRSHGGHATGGQAA